MDEQKMNQWKRTAGRLLAGFLVIMVAGTVISHAADSFLVAQVRTDNPSGKSLNFEYSGLGALVSETEKGIYPEAGFIVDEILVDKGDVIEEGTPLFRYRTEEIEEMLAAKKSEWRDLDLQYMELASEKSDSSGKTAEKAAERAVRNAEKAVKRAEENVTEAEEDLARLKETSEKDLLESKTQEAEAAAEVLEDARRQEREGVEEANHTREKAEEAVRELEEEEKQLQEKIDTYVALLLDAKSKIKDRTAALDELKIFMFGGSEAYQAHLDEVTNLALAGSTIQLAQATRREKLLEDTLKAYSKLLEELAKLDTQEDSESGSGGTQNGSRKEMTPAEIETKRQELRQQCEEKMEEIWTALYTKEGLAAAREKLEEAKRAAKRAADQEEKEAEKLAGVVEKAEKKWRKAVADLDSVKNGTYDYENELRSGEQAVIAAKRAVEDARDALEDAREEAAEQPPQAEDPGVRIKQKENAAIKREEKGREIDELEEMLSQGGIYYSELSGIVTQCKLEAGSTYAGGSAAFRIGTGNVVFEAYVAKEAESQMEEGDEINITFKGKAKGITGTVTGIAQETKDGEEVIKVTASLPEGTEGSVGKEAGYSLSKKSDFYNCCIPLSALHEDNAGKYVYVVRERDRILGKEQYVVRVDVTLLDKDGSHAAVQGSLSPEDAVVISASRSLGAGDRVRNK